MPPPWIWWLVVAANVAALAMFGFDKLMARREGQRVPEARLLQVTFLCGCVGAWIAMQLFRHKTRKSSFRWKAIAVTVVNPLWLLCWWQLRG